jgi:hypothetical protein
MTAAQTPAPELKRLLILEVAGAELADGLMQWPATRALIDARVGPTALAVAEENVERLREQLRALGMAV